MLAKRTRYLHRAGCQLAILAEVFGFEQAVVANELCVSC